MGNKRGFPGRPRPLAGLTRWLLLAWGLMISRAAVSGEAMWLQGVYYDNMNKANVKEGILFTGSIPEDTRTAEEKLHWQARNIPFKYADVELGVEGAKATVGTGVLTGSEIPMFARIGVSYAHFRSQNLAGMEAVYSIGAPAQESGLFPVGLSLKIGYYLGLQGTQNRFLLGVGMGL